MPDLFLRVPSPTMTRAQRGGYAWTENRGFADSTQCSIVTLGTFVYGVLLCYCAIVLLCYCAIVLRAMTGLLLRLATCDLGVGEASLLGC